MIPGIPYFALAAVVVAGLAYVQGRSDGKSLAEAASAREERIAALAADSAASAAAAAIRDIKVQNTTIQQRVEREIRTRVEYRDCRHPAGVLDSINEAITGKRPDPAAGSRVPASDGARR